MNLQMEPRVALGFTSASQIVRRVTEHWGALNLYCAACPSDGVEATPANTKAVDYRCGGCGAGYQLKAGRGWSEARIPDAGYEAMIGAIRAGGTPNLLVLQYSADWKVRNLLLVPSFFFTESAIERRSPLAATARRAGWIGCNILLSAIAADGKLRLVADSVESPALAVRNQYNHVRALSQLKPDVRGWTLDVLRIVRRLNRATFNLADVYRYEIELAALHPQNQNVRAKIRQQLQVLRDMGFIRFEGQGEYTVVGEVT